VAEWTALVAAVATCFSAVNTIMVATSDQRPAPPTPTPTPTPLPWRTYAVYDRRTRVGSSSVLWRYNTMAFSKGAHASPTSE
jgi:hypothetical protein